MIDRRTTVRRTVAAAATSGLMLGLVAAVAPAASAADPGPLVMAIDADTRALTVGPAAGSATPLPSLLPAAVDAVSFATSDDAGVLAIGTRSGPARAKGFPQAAYGLWVSTPTGSRIVSSSWDSSPAVTPDGATVVWTASTPEGGSILAHDVASGTSSRVCDSCVPAKIGGRPAFVNAVEAVHVGSTLRIAVGLIAVDSNDLLVSTSLKVIDIGAGGTTAAFTRNVTYATGATAFDAADIAFSTDGTTLVDVAGPRGPRGGDLFDYTKTELKLIDLGTSPATITPTGKIGYYAPRQLAGTWYLFSDDAGHTVTTMSTTTDFSTITPSVTRLDGDRTFGYRPVSSAPTAPLPPTPQAMSDRVLIPSAAAVLAGTRVGMDAYSEYQPSGEVAGMDIVEIGNLLGSWFAGGTLQGSTDGKHWASLRTTPAIVARYRYDATLVPSRTMRYRWVFPGSANLVGGVSPVRVVTVVATVTATGRTKAGRTTVAGKVSRSSGTVLLVRKAGSRWVKVAAARITSKRTYSFGARALVRGTYRVVTVGDGIQASGVSRVVAV